MSTRSLTASIRRALRRLFSQPEGAAARRGRHLSIPLRIIVGLLALIAAGTILLMLPGVGAGRSLTVMEALFTATSALTVTGLTLIAPGRDLTLAGQVILLALIQIGGVGYMFVAALALRLVGRRVPLLDRLALSTSLGLDKPAAIMQTFWRAFYGILIIEGAGAGLLYWHWRTNGIVAPDRAFFYALFHAVSAFCNAGFDLFSGLPQYERGIPGDAASLGILAGLIFTGGLGIPVLFELFTWFRWKRFSLHTRITLGVMTALTLVGWAGLFLPESTGGILRDAPLSQQLVRTLFQSVSARTAGFPGLEDFNHMLPESQLVIMVLMFIGCAPASMGGGITTGTFAVLVLAFWGYARGLPSAQVAGRSLSAGTLRRASAVLTVAIGLVVLATWLLLISHNFTLNVALFEVISAFATCGLTLGATAQLNTFGRFVIMGMMFWGRLGALTIVIAIAQRRSHNRQLVSYPEASLLIG